MVRALFLALMVLSHSNVLAQVTPLTRMATSAAITDIRYEVTFTRQTASDRLARVAMTFTSSGSDPVLLSLPAWTPGAYALSNFARWIVGFTASAGGRPLVWDKLDYDTWRIRRDALAANPITVTFEYRADTLDNAMAWARPDFLLFNGTNFFLYPEGRGFDFPARVTIRTESDWKVATSMTRASSASGVSFSAANYHDLVDMPFFVGRLDVDSAQVAGKWMRFATYPAGAIQGPQRQQAWEQLRRVTPPLAAVFGDVPWDVYTVMQIVDSAYGGASGLEHASSHVDILSPPYIGSDFQPSLYAHEIFHAWNVKRLRPADMWPYRYDGPMPTSWLWVSEGITDYYADLALVRSGIIGDSAFYQVTAGKMNESEAAGAVALEDASINTWVEPVDGTHYLYYAKGSLAGLLLDIAIRDASDNTQSLDHVMRALYVSSFKQGRGFTRDEWWAAVSRAARGRSFAEFDRKYIDGREALPTMETLSLAGLRVAVTRVPRLGIATRPDPRGLLVAEVDPTGTAAVAGIRVGDYLLSVNSISIMDSTFGEKFSAAFTNAREGQPVQLVVKREEQTLTLTGPLRLVPGGFAVSVDPNATPKAARIREGILRGTTDR